MKVQGGTEARLCFYPWRLDTYGRGCSHNCLYCSARSNLEFRDYWNDPPEKGLLTRIRKALDSPRWKPFFDKKIPLRLGSMSDCFSARERESHVTLWTLRLLKDMNHSVIILTKSPMIAEDKYIESLPEKSYIQFSITTPSDTTAALLEPGAETTHDRLIAAKKLMRKGFRVAARINPMFPTHVDGHFSKGRKGPQLKIFDWSLIDMCKGAVDTVIAGFVRLSPWNMRWLSAAGYHLSPFFTGKLTEGSYKYSNKEKQYYYEKAKMMTERNGISFSVCYDDNHAYETFRYLWEDDRDCCNGLSYFGRNYQWES
jgi:DNA repair photolyase